MARIIPGLLVTCGLLLSAAPATNAETSTELPVRDLVVALAGLPAAAGRPECHEDDGEIVQAIIIASEPGSDRFQRERFIAVADTITETCGRGDVATSALAVSGAPSSND